jgi:1-deoxyxylulose-5-phosphate synthase
LYAYDGGDREVVEAVAKVAAERGVSRAQVALAWLSQIPVVTAPRRRGADAKPARRRNRVP